MGFIKCELVLIIISSCVHTREFIGPLLGASLTQFTDFQTSSVVYLYSGTSDKGPSEIGTTSLQRTLVAQHHAITLVYYFTSEIGTTSLQGTKCLPQKCPLFGGSTVRINNDQQLISVQTHSLLFPTATGTSSVGTGELYRNITLCGIIVEYYMTFCPGISAVRSNPN